MRELDPKQFKTQPIGDSTPATVLAQCQEIQWSGIIILGVRDNGTEGPKDFLVNAVNLSVPELCTLYRMMGQFIDMEMAHER